MKKNRLIILLAGLVVSAGLIYSCTKEVATTETAAGEKSLKSAQVYPSGESDCSSVCIEPGSGDYFVKTDQQIVKWGGPTKDKFSKTIDIEMYNTETDFVLRVKSTEGWSDLVIDGVSSWTNGPVDANTWGEYFIPLEEGWNACDEINFRLMVTANANPAYFDLSYSLIGICQNCTLRGETAFGGEGVGEGSAWWYYYDGEGQEKIFAGQNEEVGTVEMVDGKIVISLENGWELKDVDEPVKIQGYAELPSDRPSAGKFTTYKGKDLFVEVAEFNYYVVHLDVEICE